MSSFLSNKFLRYRDLATGSGREIQRDRPCHACGYNLRGLKVTGRCPECGTPFDIEHDRVSILLGAGDASRSRLRIGLSLLWCSLLAAGLLRLARLLTAFFPIPLPLILYLCAGLFIAGLIIIGVRLVVTDQYDRYGRVARSLRIWAVHLQWLWLPGLALWLIGSTQTQASVETLAFVGSVLLRGGAGVGLLFVFYLLSLAAWDAEAEKESDRLMGAVWTLGILSPFAAVLPIAAFWFVFIWIAAIIILWCLIIIRLAWSIRSLERMVAWYGRTAVRAGTRIERIAARRAQIDAEVEASIRPYPSDPE